MIREADMRDREQQSSWRKIKFTFGEANSSNINVQQNNLVYTKNGEYSKILRGSQNNGLINSFLDKLKLIGNNEQSSLRYWSQKVAEALFKNKEASLSKKNELVQAHF